MKENNEDIKREEILKKIEEEFNSFIRRTRKQWKRPAITMRDGTVMSVQASTFHYCLPRENFLEDYLCYEVGYPSKVIEQLRDYSEVPTENDEELLKSVYPFVPKEVLIDILLEHGGIDMEKIFGSEEELGNLRYQKGSLEDKKLKAQELVAQFVAQMEAAIVDKNGQSSSEIMKKFNGDLKNILGDD